MIGAIWTSFRALPLWVQVWVALILVPVNMASLAFLDAPQGGWVALMAVGAMVLNGAIMLAERGFSKAMAWPHVVIWTPLVVLVALRLAEGGLGATQAVFLWILLVVDLLSLILDWRDAWLWSRGERRVAGR